MLVSHCRAFGEVLTKEIEMAKLIIEVGCGEKTCIDGDVRCNYIGTFRFGTRWVCRLFPSCDDSYTELFDDGGYLQRCDACLKSEVKV
jgi:hypothetical protein